MTEATAKNVEKDQYENENRPDLGKFPGNTFKIAKDTVGEFLEDNCLNLAAAIAYYALQSIIPLILGFIAVGSFLLQDKAARESFINGVKGAIPQQIGDATNFNEIIDGLISGAGTAGILALVTLLWTGSGIFDQFIFAVNQAFDVKKDERNFFVKLGLRLAMLFGLGLLLAVSFTITIAFQLIFNANVSILGISPKTFGFILPVLSYAIPLLLETVIFGILYKFAPARKGVHWKPVLIGALVAAVLFELLKVGFTLYVTAFGAASSATKTYGAIGGIVVFLFFVYLSASVILVGAELAAVLHGFKSGQATAKTEDAVVEKQTAEEVEKEEASSNSKDGKDKTMAKEKGEDFDFGTVEKPKVGAGVGAAIQPAYSEKLAPEKNNPVAILTGAVVLIIVAVLNTIFRRKTPAN